MIRVAAVSCRAAAGVMGMSMRPDVLLEVPVQTRSVAVAAFPNAPGGDVLRGR